MKTWGVVKFIKEEVIGSENTFLAWAVLGAMGIILSIGFYLNSPNVSFHGIAGSRESNVNFEYAVEIKRVHVISGQRVKRGDLLVELDQMDLNTQIRTMAAQIGKLKAEKSIRDQMNWTVGNSGQGLAEDPLLMDIRQLEEERSFLERRRNNLYVFAEIDGIVGSVNFKRGERAPAFSSLVTISPDSPTFVQGFVYEQLRSNVKPGSRVEINSATNPGTIVRGRVVSVGSRFVEIPVRLAPASGSSQNSGSWGREVMVEIPADSALLLGEKVQISPYSSFLPSFVANADDVAEQTFVEMAPPHPIHMPFDLASKMILEASGATYLPDLHKYLVVSDDTDKANTPYLLLVSEDGEVEERPWQIPDLAQANDMESISQDQNYIYVMTSLGSEQGGVLEPAKNIFVRTRRSSLDLSGSETIPFGSILRRLIKAVPSLQAGISELEVQAHTIRDGALYLGLKNPLANGNFAVLRIASVEHLFANRPTPVELWKEFPLEVGDNSEHRLSDMTFVGETLYFTSSCRGAPCGALWSLGEKEPKVSLLQKFKSDAPEGLAYNAQKNIFFVTFDVGKLGSKFTTLLGPRARAE